MNAELRQFFDEQLEFVLARLPQQARDLLEKVPLYVEDFPSAKIMRSTGVRRREHLCGLYTGIPMTQRSVDQSGVLSDVIHIYREGVLAMASDSYGNFDEQELREQIRITILHELGHHHGLGEEELEALGY